MSSTARIQLQRGFWRTAKTDKGLPLTTEYGLRDYTKVAKYLGLGGSRKEASWNRETMQHDCCGSKVSYCHKVACPEKTAESKG